MRFIKKSPLDVIAVEGSVRRMLVYSLMATNNLNTVYKPTLELKESDFVNSINNFYQTYILPPITIYNYSEEQLNQAPSIFTEDGQLAPWVLKALSLEENAPDFQAISNFIKELFDFMKTFIEAQEKEILNEELLKSIISSEEFKKNNWSKFVESFLTAVIKKFPNSEKNYLNFNALLLKLLQHEIVFQEKQRNLTQILPENYEIIPTIKTKPNHRKSKLKKSNTSSQYQQNEPVEIVIEDEKSQFTNIVRVNPTDERISAGKVKQGQVHS